MRLSKNGGGGGASGSGTPGDLGATPGDNNLGEYEGSNHSALSGPKKKKGSGKPKDGQRRT